MKPPPVCSAARAPRMPPPHRRRGGAGFRTRAERFTRLALLAVAALPPDALAQPRYVAPSWTFRSAAPIEWCQPVGLDRAHLAIATDRGELFILRAMDGAATAGSPLPLSPGVRLASVEAPGRAASQPTPSSLVLYERSAVISVDVHPSLLVRFRVELGPEDPRDHGGLIRKPDEDPEFLPRLAGVSAGAEGIVALAEDGRLVELDARSGTARWSARLPRLSEATLVTDSSGVTVAGRTSAGALIRRFDRATGLPRFARDLPDPQRVDWIGAIDDAVVVVMSDEILILSDGDAHRLDRPRHEKRARFALHRGGGDAVESSRLLRLTEHRLEAIALATGHTAWTADLPTGHGPFNDLRVAPDEVLVVSPYAVARLDASTGRQTRCDAAPPATRFLDVNLTGCALCIPSEADASTELTLLNFNLRSAGESQVIKLSESAKRLRETPRVVWGEPGAWIVSRNRIDRIECVSAR